MHPELWTLPGTTFVIPTYGFCMAVGFGMAIWLGVRRAKRVGANPEVMTSIGAIAGVAGVLGARGMHLVHHYWQRLTGGQMDSGEVVSTLAGGGEILGGVLLAGGCVVIYLAVTHQPIRRYLDITAPTVILAMAIGRIGCLMYGCCWGQVCTTQTGDAQWPWAVHFPYGRPAYVTQWQRGQLTVPDDLLMTSPITGRPEPIPAKLLADDTLVQNEALQRFAEHYVAMGKLSDSEKTGLAGTELRSKMQPLRPLLPGASKLQRSDYVAGAVHLHRLAGARNQETKEVLASLRQLAGHQKSLWVHPTQIYDAISLSWMFLLLSAIFFRTRRPGMVCAWLLVLYPVSRFCLEMLRADNPRDVGGLTVSQALSVGILAGGLLFMIVLVKSSSPPLANLSAAPAD